jgi:FtsP/CotA-like multicopper oxidase with cupredoxin domain/peroxiredoxin
MMNRIGNQGNKAAARSSAFLPRFAAAIVLIIGAGAGLNLGWGQPAKSRETRLGRSAKRPPTARIQTSLDLASQTKAEFRPPEEWAYKQFNKLVLQTGTFANANAGDLGLPSQFQLLCFNNQPVGPTIRVRRGTTFHIHVKNDLPPPIGQPPGHGGTDNSEQPHELCTTNLHTHGLHVSPVGNGDNVEGISIEPGKDFIFEYTVPADHPSGTFWYHPHRHGSVAYQLSNGLAGALIVEGTPGDTIADLDDVPEIAAAQQRIFVFQLYNYRVDPPDNTGVGRIDATTIYDILPDRRSCPGIAVPDNEPDQTGQVTAINGVINPIVRLVPGEVQRWRLIHAAWDLNRKLYLVDKDGKPATDLTFNEIALDGLATGTMLAKRNDPQAGGTVEIAPGQRSDVLIQAPLLKNDEPERIYHLVQSGDDPTTKPLALIRVSGMPNPMRLPDPNDLAKCKPFADIGDDELAKEDKSEIALNGLKFFASLDGANKRFSINTKTYTHYKTPVQIRVETAEEWQVRAVSDQHPFHVHVNPFQVTQRKDANGNITPMKVWRDTLLIPQGEAYTIRSRFKDFLGHTVLHCHFLDHEDQGMMMPVEFIPPYQKPQPAQMVQGRALTPKATTAPALKLADAEGTWHELTKLRSRNVLLVFFQGIECAHCSQQLSKLMREVGASIDPETEILAISSRRISDPSLLLKTLVRQVPRRIHLLVDEGCGTFRSFGCYRNGPLHGLFLIDRAGVIRASYTGETPFDDVQAVADSMKSLADAGMTRASP